MFKELCGYINMEVNQKINSDSNSEIEIVYDLAEKDHVYVESQELNLLWNLGVIAIIIGIVTIILIFKRRM